jgi:hypothetical protein
MSLPSAGISSMHGVWCGMLTGYKLFRVRKDGTLGPLFVGCSIRVPIRKWVKARAIRKAGFKFRPGWHCCKFPWAPHLSKTGRVWCSVSLKGVKKHQRPLSQGGLWYTAKWMRVNYIVTPDIGED